VWARLDDRFHENGKQLAMSDAAFRLYVCGLTYAAAQDESGVLTVSRVSALCGALRKGPRQVEELVRLRAWEAVDGGWRIHDFGDYAGPLDATAAERQRRYRDRHRNALRNGNSNDVPPAPPYVPDPTRPDPTETPPSPLEGVGKNPRAEGTNPRAQGKNPRARRGRARSEAERQEAYLAEHPDAGSFRPDEFSPGASVADVAAGIVRRAR
jgi:hypothetical protein